MPKQVSRWGPNPGRDFYTLHQELLWAPIDPLPKLILIDLFHHEKRGDEVPSLDERARKFNVSKRSLMRAEEWLETNGYLLVNRGLGRRNLYAAAYPAVPDGDPNRPAFQEFVAGLSAEDASAKLSPVTESHQCQIVTGSSDNLALVRARDPLPDENTVKTKAPSGPCVAGFWNRFEETYPPRSGSTGKAEARRRFEGLVKSGVDPEAIIAGTERYRHWAEATGQIGTQWIQRMTTFLGKEKGWEELWDNPQQTNGRQPRWNGRGLRPGQSLSDRQQELLRMVEDE